jgi:hypothetical protein
MVASGAGLFTALAFVLSGIDKQRSPGGTVRFSGGNHKLAGDADRLTCD